MVVFSRHPCVVVHVIYEDLESKMATEESVAMGVITVFCDAETDCVYSLKH